MKLLQVNGFTVLHIPHPSNLISIRVAVNAGSANEIRHEDYGVAHFLEHMFFKGTNSRNYKQLNIQMAGLGESNAYTSFTRTAFYINTIKNKFNEATDLLVDMLLDPLFDKDEFDKEKNVILEELQTYADQPSSYYYYKSFEHIFGSQGHDIVGTVNSLNNMDIEQLKNFRLSNYTKDNMVFVVCGNIDESFVVESMTKSLSKAVGVNDKIAVKRTFNPMDWSTSEYRFEHPAEQAFVSLYFPSLSPMEKKKQHEISSVFCNALGGGLHSVLGSKIREEMGLCYSISARHAGFEECRATMINTQLKPENVEVAIDTIIKEIEQIAENGFDENLIETAKSNVTYGMVEESETSDGFAGMFGDDYLEMKTIYDLSEMNVEYFINEFNKIDNNQLIEHAKMVLSAGPKITMMNG